MRFCITLLSTTITLLSAVPSLACKCDPGPVQALYQNPLLAQTAFIGKSEGRGKKRVFKVLMSWTPYRDIIKSPAVSKCSLDTKPGHTYLIFSTAAPEDIEKRKIGFGICDSYASEVADAEPIVEKLSARPVNGDLSPNPSWFYCTKDTECVAEKGVCSDSVGVNKKFRERMKLWALKSAPTVNCISSRDIPTGKVLCKNYFCEAQVKPPVLLKKTKTETMKQPRPR